MAGLHQPERGQRPGFPAGAERLVGDLEDRAERGDLRVVHQDVDSAQSAYGGLDAAPDVARPGHVRDDGQRRTAGFLDLRRHSRQLGLGAADQRDGRALGGESERDAPADPLAAAGDDGPLAVQCPCHDPPDSVSLPATQTSSAHRQKCR